MSRNDDGTEDHEAVEGEEGAEEVEDEDHGHGEVHPAPGSPRAPGAFVNAALPCNPVALRVNRTVPTTQVRLGPFAFDGLKALLGVDLADMLALLMIGPKSQRPVLGGVVDVHPLAIPDGEGHSVPIQLLGEIGLKNLRSLLVLVVPIAAMDVVTPQLASEIATGDAAGPRVRVGSSGGHVAEYAVRLKPGMRKAVPLGAFGELGGRGDLTAVLKAGSPLDVQSTYN